MTMNAVQQNIISTASRVIKIVLAEEGTIGQIDVLNEEFKAEMTTENIQTIPSFAEMELTSEDVQAGIAILKACAAALGLNTVAVAKLGNLR